MQPFCPDGNIKCEQFGSKVKFTKMRTKHAMFVFSKTPLELNEGDVSTFTTFEYERIS